MGRVTVRQIAILVALSASMAAQAAGPRFVVASIRPAPSIQQVLASHQTPHAGTKIDAGRVDIGFASLQDLICAAYKVKPYQVSGPDFLATQRFDILATIPAGVSPDQAPAMLQALLADRFQLTLHRQSKSLPVYALIVGPSGAKLTPAAADADAVAAAQAKEAAAHGAQTLAEGDAGTATVVRSDGGQGASMTVTGGKNGPMQMEMGQDGLHLVADRLTMPALADLLTGLTGRPVLDETAMTGAYQVSLAMSRDDLMAMARVQAEKLGMPVPPAAAGSAPAPSGHSITEAVEKLGLKLDARNAPVDLLVVDHIDKVPTAN